MLRWMMLAVVVICVADLTAIGVVPEEPAKPVGESEPLSCLELTLKANKAEYELNRGGKSAEAYSKAIRTAECFKDFPPQPEVDLEAILTNRGENTVQVWVTGDPVVLSLVLEGEGAICCGLRSNFVGEVRMPKAIELEPGKSHTIKINALRHGKRGISEGCYWTEPGEYTLTAKFTTALSPMPKDAKPSVHDEKFGDVILTSSPIRLKVTEK